MDSTMDSTRDSTMDSPYLNQRRTRTYFLILLSVFALIDLLSWPSLFSFKLWVLMDRGSFLNLDYLVRQHLRLGVDVYYAYGLLPVAMQHWLFAFFGMGYLPLIGCAAVTLILMAWFWALLLRNLPREVVWLVTIVAACHLIHWVNPNFPYSIVQLSLLFSLLLVLMGRLDVALAIAAIGAWSVPSLPLGLMGLLVICIFLQWLLRPQRTALELVRSLAPGVATYLIIGLLLLVEFGKQSVFATATPLAGMRFYGKMHYGWMGSSLVQFLHPPYHTTSYYLVYSICTPVCWWVFSVLSLCAFGLMALRRMLVARMMNNRDLVLVLCAILHTVFFCFAYGSPHQHVIYDPLLAMGVVLGLSAMAKGKVRRAFVVSYICLAILGQADAVRSTYADWKTVRSPLTDNLYASKDWIAEWSHILDLSSQQNLLLLSYGTGVHDYFPTVHSADAWFLNPAQLSVDDKDRLMGQLKSADVVALDLSSPTAFVDGDADVQEYLKSLCLRESTKYFQVWWKRKPVGMSEGSSLGSGQNAGQVCIEKAQPLAQDAGAMQ